jgi:hypothetical protein
MHRERNFLKCYVANPPRRERVSLPLIVMERLNDLCQQTDALRLYALVDGAQYQTHRGARLTLQAALYSRFDVTPDAALAHAGSWLVDTEHIGDAFVADLAALEQRSPPSHG